MKESNLQTKMQALGEIFVYLNFIRQTNLKLYNKFTKKSKIFIEIRVVYTYTKKYVVGS